MIYDQDDQEKLVKQVLRDMKVEEAGETACRVEGYRRFQKCGGVESGEALKQSTTRV